MEMRALGRHGLTVPAVTFGAWAIGGWYWGGSDDRESIRALHAAVDQGMVMVDTAPMYGCGHSETVVGKALAGRRNHVLIATKCGLRWDTEEGTTFFKTIDHITGKPITVTRNLKPHSIREECERSLRRLAIDHIDLYQCHWPDASTGLEDTLGELVALQGEGKIRHIGLSNFSADDIAKAAKLACLSSDQPEYSLIKRDIERDVVPACVETKVGILAYSPLAQGLLTGAVTMEREFPPTDGRSRDPWFKPVNRQRVLDALKPIVALAKDRGCTVAQMVIAWTIAQPGITSAIVGARTPAQVEENVGAGGVHLETRELTAIHQAFVGLDKPL